MLWEIDIFPAPSQPDFCGKQVAKDAAALGIAGNVTAKTAYGYLIQGDLTEEQVKTLIEKLLVDEIVETAEFFPVGKRRNEAALYVLPKPGVTDTAAESVRKATPDFGFQAEAIRTFKKYWISGVDDDTLRTLATKQLANDAIEQVVFGELPFDKLTVGSSYEFKLVTVPIRGMDDVALQKLSKEGMLCLSLAEMQTIRKAFVELGRDPTDVELETLAQTWSEHCSHKTLGGRIHYVRENADGTKFERHFTNMLKETIFAATQELCKTNPRVRDFCVSVFADNAGVVTFDDEYNVCFKAETHNRPSAIEPYGGAHTGLGGCMRDVMGTGLGAKPVASTTVSCFAPPDIDPKEIPAGVLHPRRLMMGAAAGAKDYGNKMGVPTVNGALYFDKRYLGNPLVFCGNIGILPKDKSFKEPKPGDLIVALGAPTGRDGIHGATFSSGELTHESETFSGGAVQIGDVTVQKAFLDVMLKARDRNLYNAVTDCGAGGFSSAAGEMGEKIGVDVELTNAPVKYEGLSYTEIWISEAQERMVLAVPPGNWDEFKKLCDDEDVSATVLGTFKPTGHLVLKYNGNQVADLDMKLLHKGRPPVVRYAVYKQVGSRPPGGCDLAGTPVGSCAEYCTLPPGGRQPTEMQPADILFAILSSLNVASKHSIIRQYDHEVQGGSVIKPLVGANDDGPGDAAVVRPRLDSQRGLVISCGMNPHYGDLDPYRMAASGIDEAVRNCVAVGADPSTIALLDNFCWGNTERPETLGSLVEAALACYDVSVGFEMPFISGKDSLNNEFRPEGKEPISIPPTLLISAMGQVDDVSTCVTMDLKKAGNVLYQLGETKNEFGGSHYYLAGTPVSIAGTPVPLTGTPLNNVVPFLDVPKAKKLYETLHRGIKQGLFRSVHDLSEGGLAVTLAEMCFAGNFGAKLEGSFDTVALFSESNSRFVVEVEADNVAAFESFFAGLPFRKLGKVTEEKTLIFGDALTANVDELKAAWQHPLGND